MNDVAEDGKQPVREEPPDSGETGSLAWLRRLKKERDERHEAQRRTEATTVRFTKQTAERLQRHAERLGISVPRYVEILCTYRDPGDAAQTQELLSEIRAAAVELEEALSKEAPAEAGFPGDAPYEQMRERVAGLRRRVQELDALHGKHREASGSG